MTKYILAVNTPTESGYATNDPAEMALGDRSKAAEFTSLETALAVLSYWVTEGAIRVTVEVMK